MKIVKIALAAMAVAGFASTAAAQDTGAYINIGVDTYEFDVYNLGGKIGYNFTENFGVEGQGSFGVTSDNGAKIESAFGGFAIARLPVSEEFDLFVRGGYHTTQTNFGDADGFAAGGGIQYFFTENDGIRLEYTYLDANGGNADTFGVSYVRNF